MGSNNTKCRSCDQCHYGEEDVGNLPGVSITGHTDFMSSIDDSPTGKLSSISLGLETMPQGEATSPRGGSSPSRASEPEQDERGCPLERCDVDWLQKLSGCPALKRCCVGESSCARWQRPAHSQWRPPRGGGRTVRVVQDDVSDMASDDLDALFNTPSGALEYEEEEEPPPTVWRNLRSSRAAMARCRASDPTSTKAQFAATARSTSMSALKKATDTLPPDVKAPWHAISTDNDKQETKELHSVVTRPGNAKRDRMSS
eukprot:Skav228669  [mRNA]  locus=scaffold1332:207987:217572:- [translate_table: standard]